MFLPESLKKRVVAAKNVALGFSKIGDADRKRAARTQTAFAVTGVLPQVPASPRRGGPRLVVIIGDPKPAIGKHSAMSGGRAATVQHLPQTIFAFAMSPFQNWQELAWAGVFLITIGVLLLNILARVLFRKRD